MSTITIIGSSFADILPDRVQWSLDVREADADTKAAFDRCTTRVGALARALEAFEVTTGHVGFKAEWHTHGHKQTGRRIAYAALIVTAPLDQATAIATTAMDAGADEVHGPRLLYPEAARDELFPRAVEAARRNADAIAAAAGRRAGRVVNITDPATRMRSDEYAYAVAASGGGGEDRDVPLLAEPRRISATLICEFELVD